MASGQAGCLGAHVEIYVHAESPALITIHITQQLTQGLCGGMGFILLAPKPPACHNAFQISMASGQAGCLGAYVEIYVHAESSVRIFFYLVTTHAGTLLKRKAIRIIVAMVIISGPVYAVASTTTPTVVYGCNTSGC
jgi:hypothetical protein